METNRCPGSSLSLQKSWIQIVGFDNIQNVDVDMVFLKPQLHIHDFGHGRATTHPDLSSRDASAWVVAAP